MEKDKHKQSNEFDILWNIITAGKYTFTFSLGEDVFKCESLQLDEVIQTNDNIPKERYILDVISSLVKEVNGVRFKDVNDARTYFEGMPGILFIKVADAFSKKLTEYLTLVSDEKKMEEFVKHTRGYWKVFSFAYRGRTGVGGNEVLQDFKNPFLMRWVLMHIREDDVEEVKRMIFYARLNRTEGIGFEFEDAKKIIRNILSDEKEKGFSAEFKKLADQELKNALRRKELEEYEQALRARGILSIREGDKKGDEYDEFDEFDEDERIPEPNREEKARKWKEFLEQAKREREEYIQRHKQSIK